MEMKRFLIFEKNEDGQWEEVGVKLAPAKPKESDALRYEEVDLDYVMKIEEDDNGGH